MVVKWIFEQYAQGLSYKRIAKQLDMGKFPMYNDTGWTQHHVKRILENERYMGNEIYPPIISSAVFRQARAIHNSKNIESTKKVSTDYAVLWKLMRCGKCGSRMIRLGGLHVRKGDMIVRCANHECMETRRFNLHGFLSNVLRLQDAALASIIARQDNAYALSEDILKLSNQTNREIEKPDDPPSVIQHILEGISARYGGLRDPLRDLPLTISYEMEIYLPEIDWKLLPEVFSYIGVGQHEIVAGLVNGKEISVTTETDG
jgi:hypothetical protein